ncbi:adenosylcobinamide-GDP ribazoletransferase [Micropruina sp.]|uniref:adenosylcobinamide-GDP ribazoletransferase n=1 Tax=Micropruina sp. TaxID=2737536 RepID=UPI0039E4AB77
MIGGLRLALAFLTVIPVPVTASIGRRQARAAMLLGWLAIAPVGLAAGLAGWAGSRLGLPSLLAGVVCIGVLALGTRAIHLDGLADTVDGLGSGPDRDKALRVMRSGDIGPMGAATLVLVLIAQATGLGAVLGVPWGWLQVAGLVVASRVALPLGCARGVPAARHDGLGALFAGSVPRAAAAALWTGSAVALGGLGVLAGRPWWLGVLAVAVALLGSVLLLRRCIRRFGGITGDVLGALVELTFTLLVVVTCA